VTNRNTSESMTKVGKSPSEGDVKIAGNFRGREKNKKKNGGSRVKSGKSLLRGAAGVSKVEEG